MKKILLFIMFFFLLACSYSNPNTTQRISPIIAKDIPIPKGMKMVNKDSSLVKVLSNKEKCLVFKGNLDTNFLFDYYMVFMRKNNWHLRAYVKCKNSVLIFEKHPRICVIFIQKRTFSTFLLIFELRDINFLKKITIYEEKLTK